VLNVIWKLFDVMFLGGLQAFIFALLTVLYFGMAGAGHEEHDDDHGAEPEAEKHDHEADAAEAHASAEPEPAH
jgi:F-type H+-transporting ATPase subunit a